MRSQIVTVNGDSPSHVGRGSDPDRRPAGPANTGTADSTPADATTAAAPEQSGSASEASDNNQPAKKFQDWLANYQQTTDAAGRARMELDGETFAQARRERMAHLIETDPE